MTHLRLHPLFGGKTETKNSWCSLFYSMVVCVLQAKSVYYMPPKQVQTLSGHVISDENNSRSTSFYSKLSLMLLYCTAVNHSVGTLIFLSSHCCHWNANVIMEETTFTKDSWFPVIWFQLHTHLCVWKSVDHSL